MNLSKKAGMNLKRIIKEKGYTQVKFAYELGVNPSTLNRWFKYGIDSLNTVEQISIKLEVSYLDIIGED